jgi:hypothetical protein
MLGRSPTPLLRLLWMKRQLLSLHPLNQFPDPIKQRLIREPEHQETIVLCSRPIAKLGSYSCPVTFSMLQTATGFLMRQGLFAKTISLPSSEDHCSP